MHIWHREEFLGRSFLVILKINRLVSLQ
uniref:Uncharacterized protein n=1 Tax=Rhizophora mucronata TaxID=61149 RepID=A0A2P2R4F7_RHIMU